MKLESLKLRNFRCFADLLINFDERLTVLVGRNGSGKTAVLDALAYYLEKICLGFTSLLEQVSLGHIPEATLLSMKNSDILNDENDMGLRVQLKSSFDDNAPITPNFELLFVRNIFGDIAKDLDKQNYVDFIRSVTRFCEIRKNETSEVGLPILVYYQSKRAIPQIKSIFEDHKKIDLETAFINAFSREIDLNNALDWFSVQDAKEARIVRDEDHDYRIPELETVRQAIVMVLGSYESPRISQSGFVVSKKGSKDAYTLEQLSEGHQIMLALSLDLARRMAAANSRVAWGEGQTVLHSQAIVLIDEIELHLHPSWQQTVLPTLLRIFPNAQFIVTTHSPQILTSIEPRHIRILQNGQVWRTDSS
ncbi:MAG: AAA family ATPase, partial [Deltaproteobacteria bacterium]|nr:AAA family ATPase [Deltaproteobacteria bacterium]